MKFNLNYCIKIKAVQNINVTFKFSVLYTLPCHSVIPLTGYSVVQRDHLSFYVGEIPDFPAQLGEFVNPLTGLSYCSQTS